MTNDKRDECRTHIVSLLRNIGRPATFDEVATVYCVTYQRPDPRAFRERVSGFVSQMEKTGLIRADYDQRGYLIQCHARRSTDSSS